MEATVVVCGQVFTPAVLDRINATVGEQPRITRAELARRVCDWLGWRTPQGRLKAINCRVALLRLAERGLIELPPPRCRVARPKSLAHSENVAARFTGTLQEVRGLKLVRVSSKERELDLVWKKMVAVHHYLGYQPLCGAQLRYLIGSEQGWLGALAFSAAAFHLKGRDRWIGWSAAARQCHLSKVVANSRFVIARSVRVNNLASKVLALAPKRLPTDWAQAYGYRPLLLESYVEARRFSATSYRAANWIKVGKTCGRGRQDRAHQNQTPIKDIYVYPLASDWQKQLCEEPGPARCMVGLGQAAKPPGDWAEQELGRVKLRDRRHRQRLCIVARDFYAQPGANIPQACQSRAKTKAAYRFLTHPETTMDRVLESHVAATAQRIAKERIVLAVQDTTSLNYSTHPATAQLGPIGSRPDGLIGLLVHDTMAFSLAGTPLGLLDVQCWARDGAAFGKKHHRRQHPIEQKESAKWLRSFRRVAALQQRCPHTTLVSVGDREADVYELFHLALETPQGPKLLVRAEQDRLLTDGQAHLWPTVEQQPLAGVQELAVPRRGGRPPRVARLEIRLGDVTLKPPQRKSGYGPVTLWAVLAQEVAPPDGIDPLRWMLLTTCRVTDFAEAIEKLEWYTKRWGIEIYHRTLKSGCQIEERQLGSADSIEACLAIDMVVAWRIYHLTKLGRDVPDVPCTVFFEEAEWKALHTYITKTPFPPAEPPSLRHAIRMVASLGGFLGRKSDGEPGTQTLWLGLQRVDDLAAIWKILVPHLRPPPVSGKPTYG